VLVRYVLPPGSGHHTRLWGLDRHEWGTVHFWIALGFLAVLALHLFLHWRWIVCVLRGRPRQGSGARLALGMVGVLAILAVAVTPFGSPLERTENARRRTPQVEASGHEGEQIRGRMTLAEIEQSTGVPPAYLIERLGMPHDVPRDWGVAKLGREYGFAVDEVREMVRQYASDR
jgi:hypothetical protein